MSFPVPLPSTFMPLPLAIMIPFMGIQSGVMAQQFGTNFQYGKRKISAMSNEEFNKLTPEMLQADMASQIKNLIPTFEQSLMDMRPFQRMIFVEMLAAFKEAVQLGIDVGVAGAESISHAVGGPHIGHEGPVLPKGTEHKFLSPLEIRVHKRHGHLGGETTKTQPTQPTIPPVGTTFTRTLAQAQADTSRSRGTGIISTTPIVKRLAGQSAILERNKIKTEIQRLLALRATYQSRLNGSISSQTRTQLNMWVTNIGGELNAENTKLQSLQNKYRFKS